jgi:hypothetical protein
MLTLKSALAATLITVAAATAGAQSLPNYAGTWEMNPAKSNFGQFPAPAKNVMVIEQTATTIKVAQTVAGPNGDITLNQEYSLEGKTTTGSGYGGATTSTIATFDASGLATKTKVSTPQGEMSQTSKWTLAPDGKTLSIDQGMTSPMGELSFHVVFEKKP